MNAYDALLDYLLDGEVVESLIFMDQEAHKRRECILVPTFYPMYLAEVESAMRTWSFVYCGWTQPLFAQMTVWTNKRIISVYESSNVSELQSSPRYLESAVEILKEEWA